MRATIDTILKWSSAALLVLATSNSLATERATQTVGEAYDLDSGELLYLETHCVNPDESEREVFYIDSEGNLLARKLVNYGSGAVTPSFEQHNFYSSELISVALSDDQLTMAVFDKSTQQPRSEVSLQPGNELPVVIDAGFDAFVRQNWDSLVSGEAHRFQFPFADRESLVNLRITRRGCSYDSDSDQCFKLDLSNWFLRVLVEPIELGYDKGSRQLTRYRGLSNIGDISGNGLVVDLRYSYQNIPENACHALLKEPSEGNGAIHVERLAAVN